MQNSSSRISKQTATDSSNLEFSEAQVLIGSKHKIVETKRIKNAAAEHHRKDRKLIGHAAIKAENLKSQNDVKKQIAGVDKLSRTSLLEMAAEIDIDGSNLRKIYDTKLIGEKGLRRAIKAHLSQSDIKQVLREEIIEENSFLNPVNSSGSSSLIDGLKSKFMSTRAIDALIVSVITALAVMLIIKLVNG